MSMTELIKTLCKFLLMIPMNNRQHDPKYKFLNTDNSNYADNF